MTTASHTRRTPDKRTLYRTARATVACAIFKVGDYLTVEYHRSENGTDWYKVTSITGESTWYPGHHLAEFVL